MKDRTETGKRRARRPADGSNRVERRFSLSAEAARRLDVHAAGSGERPARILERLILDHLRRYVLQDRGAHPGGGAGGGETPGPGAGAGPAAGAA